MRFHQAGVEETATSLLKKGWQIHLKNRRLHKSTQTRAPTIEILPVLSPNKVMGVAKSVSLRDKQVPGRMSDADRHDEV
jgi:hypothetical protein